MRNLEQLTNDVAVLLQRSGDSDYATKIHTWINLGQKTLFDVYDHYFELRKLYTFTTVSGTEAYFMPLDFDKPIRIYDVTNDKKITIVQADEYFDANISNIVDSSTAKPDSVRIDGYSAIKRAVSSSGTTVKVKSSSGSDTSGIVVRIEGYLDSSKTVFGYENITISTSAPQTFVSGSTTFYDITHVSKSADTSGYITIADSSSNTLTELGMVDRVARYPVLRLGKIPNAAISMRVYYKKKVNRLVNKYDYPFIDADDYLILEAYGYGLSEEKEGVEKSQIAWKKAKDLLANILINQNSKLGPEFQHKFESVFLQSHR